MDFLLNEREKTLTEMRINEACASDKSAWQLRTSKGGSPAELQALLQKSSAESIRLFVQDRVLCDVPRGPASEENRRAYREYREVLSMPRLQRITPLANQDRSFKPMDEPDSYSVCTYGPSSSEHIQMEPPHEHLEEASKGASWNVLRTEIDAPRRLDCWYYQKRFRDLRVDRTKWRQFSDCLTLDTDRARRSPVAECHGRRVHPAKRAV